MNRRVIFIFSIIILFFNNIIYSQSNIKADTIVIKQLLEKANFFLKVNRDSAFYYSNQALVFSIKTASTQFISQASECLGNAYILKEDFGKATYYFVEALKIEEKRQDNHRIADLQEDLGRIYQLLENFNKSLNYYISALYIYEKYKDTINIAKSIRHIGSLYSSREFCEPRTKQQKLDDFKTAFKYYEKSLFLSRKVNSEDNIIECYASLGRIYNKLDQSQNAIPYLIKALNYYLENENWEELTEIYYNLGKSYCNLKQYDLSAQYYLKSIELSNLKNLKQGIQFVYEELAYTYDLAGNYKASRDSYVKYMTIRDSIYNNEKSKQIFELETKYQSEKKEKEILVLSLKEKKQSEFITILVFIILIITILGAYIVYSVRTKRKIAEQNVKIKEQKIRELKKEQLLLSTQLVLEGEEIERKRIARDLHDGLGGLLSGVKLSFNNLKGNIVLPARHLKDFDHAISMLDKSIIELRRVAHSMMPETLVKFGLKDALSDFCDALNAAVSMNVKFQFFGEFKRMEQNIEIGSYRIVQELINNAVKHAEADELIVQMMQEANRLSLVVQDNGKGFDLAFVKQAKGMGLNSVKTRVDALNGRIDIYSELNKGSEFTIEFDLK